MESKGKLVPKNERILRAAEAVFSKKGYRQATLDEIVKIADTGKGTVYKYFNNKHLYRTKIIFRYSRHFDITLLPFKKRKAFIKTDLCFVLDYLVNYTYSITVTTNIIPRCVTTSTTSTTSYISTCPSHDCIIIKIWHILLSCSSTNCTCYSIC